MHILPTQLSSVHAALNSVSPLAEEAWSLARPMFASRTFDAAEHIIQAGDIVNDLFFLTSGLTRFYYLDEQGKEFNKSFSTTGQVISSISSLAEAMPSPFYVQAIVSSACLRLPYQQFLELAAQHHQWRSLHIRLLERLIIRKEHREADFLLCSATERYKRFLRDYIHIADRLPNYHIASYLGITEVALSRIRRRMGLTQVNDNDCQPS